MKAGLLLSSLILPTASRSVARASVFGSLAKPTWLSLTCTKLNGATPFAGAASAVSSVDATDPLAIVHTTPAPAHAAQRRNSRRSWPSCFLSMGDRPSVSDTDETQ